MGPTRNGKIVLRLSYMVDCTNPDATAIPELTILGDSHGLNEIASGIRKMALIAKRGGDGELNIGQLGGLSVDKMKSHRFEVRIVGLRDSDRSLQGRLATDEGAVQLFRRLAEAAAESEAEDRRVLREINLHGDA